MGKLGWFLLGVGSVWVYHHFAPGKGIGQPGSVGS